MDFVKKMFSHYKNLIYLIPIKTSLAKEVLWSLNFIMASKYLPIDLAIEKLIKISMVVIPNPTKMQERIFRYKKIRPIINFAIKDHVS